MKKATPSISHDFLSECHMLFYPLAFWTHSKSSYSIFEFLMEDQNTDHPNVACYMLL